MDLKDRATAVKETARSRFIQAKAERAHGKVERASEAAERLQAENAVLRDQVEQDRADRDRMMAALERLSATKERPRPKKHRIRHLFTFATAAGAAYVAGTKAGRERYDQLRAKWNELTNRPEMDQMREHGSEIAERASDTIDPAGS